jgi:hypothetical protein
MSLTTVPINHITDWAMGPGSRRADGPKTGHALTFILDHLNRADQFDQISCSKISFRL